jgi:hypothetical protein
MTRSIDLEVVAPAELALVVRTRMVRSTRRARIAVLASVLRIQPYDAASPGVIRATPSPRRIP